MPSIPMDLIPWAMATFSSGVEDGYNVIHILYLKLIETRIRSKVFSFGKILDLKD